ncbi:hypothetical protein BST61_g12 [Cercospora zeina]
MRFWFVASVALSIWASCVSAQVQPCVVDEALPSPAGSICGVRGRVTTPGIIRRLVSTVLQSECARQCKVTTGCQSFTFTPRDLQCILYRTGPRGQGFQADSRASTWFWNNNCYTTRVSCPGRPSVVTSTSTVVSTIRQTTTIPGPVGTMTVTRRDPPVTTTVTLAAETSTTSITVEKPGLIRTSTVTLSAAPASTVTPPPGTVTVISTGAIPSPQTITQTIHVTQIETVISDSECVANSSTTSTASSTTSPSTLTTTSSTSSTTTISTTSRPPASPTTIQVVRDPSFENYSRDASTSPWRTFHGARVGEGNAQDGTYRAELSVDPGEALLYQDVNTVLGTNYTLTYYSFAATFCLFCGGALVSQNDTPVGDTDWVKHEATFTATDRVTRLQFYSGSSLGTGRMQIDNVTLLAESDTDEAQCSVVQQERVVNGNFENSADNFAPWTFGPNGAPVTGLQSFDGGENAAGITPAADTFSHDYTYGNVSQTVRGLVPGRAATLTYHALVPGIVPVDCGLCGRYPAGHTTIHVHIDESHVSVKKYGVSSHRLSGPGTEGRYEKTTIHFVPTSDTAVISFTIQTQGFQKRVLFAGSSAPPAMPNYQAKSGRCWLSPAAHVRF